MTEELFPQTPLDKAVVVLTQLQAGVESCRKRVDKAHEKLEYAEMLVSKQESAIEALVMGAQLNARTGEVASFVPQMRPPKLGAV